VAVHHHVLLPEPQGLARGQPQLGLDQVEAAHHLGHRVLDLQARVELEEEELLQSWIGARGDQELTRARALVACRPHHGHRRLAHAGAQLAGDRGRGALLDELLVAALQAALALAQVHCRAV